MLLTTAATEQAQSLVRAARLQTASGQQSTLAEVAAPAVRLRAAAALPVGQMVLVRTADLVVLLTVVQAAVAVAQTADTLLRLLVDRHLKTALRAVTAMEVREGEPLVLQMQEQAAMAEMVRPVAAEEAAAVDMMAAALGVLARAVMVVPIPHSTHRTVVGAAVDRQALDQRTVAMVELMAAAVRLHKEAGQHKVLAAMVSS